MALSINRKCGYRFFIYLLAFNSKKFFSFAGLHTPGRCDFEADLCHWQNMTDDKFDWQRHSGNTPSAATGPMYDHTRGFGGNGTSGCVRSLCVI